MATPVVADDHKPPVTDDVNVVVPEEQSVVVPEIVPADGAAVTVTVAAALVADEHTPLVTTAR